MHMTKTAVAEECAMRGRQIAHTFAHPVLLGGPPAARKVRGQQATFVKRGQAQQHAINSSTGHTPQILTTHEQSLPPQLLPQDPE